MRTLVWFRGKDLRVADHAPLREGADSAELVALFVLAPRYFERGQARQSAHRVQFLLESLAALAHSLEARGGELVVVAGEREQCVPELARAFRVDRVLAQRCVEPAARASDARIAATLSSAGIPFVLTDGETLCAPGSLRSQAGTPYAVFTRFALAFERSIEPRDPLPAPRRLPPLPRTRVPARVAIPSLASLGLAHNPALLSGGEPAAHERLHAFLEGPAGRYDHDRDQLAPTTSSRLSADLKFGTLSVRTVLRAVRDRFGNTAAGDKFVSELLWREFNYSTLWDRPELVREPFRREFIGFPWRTSGRELEAWSAGRTGYPVVDAASRQLLAEGFIPNRARMIHASFLTKHLLIDYKLGEAHYMQHLTDGDLPQNNANWQWTAGCGCDAQPYFRVFNPVTQGEKFDAQGAYVKRWLPELSDLPERYVHRPWLAPSAVLAAARVRLGTDYPPPMVDHALARERFLSVAREHLQNARARAARG